MLSISYRPCNVRNTLRVYCQKVTILVLSVSVRLHITIVHTDTDRAVQSQKTVSVYFTSKQILHFSFAEQ